LFKETLGNYQLVFDAVYTPRKTRLLKDADAAGAITVSGVEMFLRQAIGQFNLFTGREGISPTSPFYRFRNHPLYFFIVSPLYSFQRPTGYCAEPR
jgi:shikimate 5-dehydrogenase